MIQKSRLKKMREYTSDDGNFPTNIVLNLEKSKYSRFDIGKQEGTPQGATVGWLTLTPAYKSAWVIDGQHRLFAALQGLEWVDAKQAVSRPPLRGSLRRWRPCSPPAHRLRLDGPLPRKATGPERGQH